MPSVGAPLFPFHKILGGGTLAGVPDDFVRPSQPVLVDCVVFGEVVTRLPSVVGAVVVLPTGEVVVHTVSGTMFDDGLNLVRFVGGMWCVGGVSFSGFG